MGFGGVFTDRWRLFHHLTRGACCSWPTRVMLSSALGSPPKTIGLSYHTSFRSKRSAETDIESRVGRWERNMSARQRLELWSHPGAQTQNSIPGRGADMA